MRKFLYIFCIILAVSGCKKESTLIADYANDTKADFTPAEGKYGLFTFTNNSKNAITYLWDFGDGNKSTETSPSHRYEKTGVYTVKLICKNGDIASIKTKTINVNSQKPYYAKITKIILYEHPQKAYDNTGGTSNFADLALWITDGLTYFDSRNNPIMDVPYNQVTTFNIQPLKLLDLEIRCDIRFYDMDDNGSGDYVTGFSITPGDYKTPQGSIPAYPDEITLTIGNTPNKTEAKFFFEWF